jgi:RNA polymerase sigma factor (sigma-70 family)
MTLLAANETESDATLVELSRLGDQPAYGQLVARHQTLVCSVAYAKCGDFALSEDLAQEAFLTAWKKLTDLQDSSKFKSWICTIVRNLASRTFRQQHPTAELNETTLTDGCTTTPESEAISAEESRLVWQAIESLPENYREPLILFYREEESVARVAEALELSPDAVKQRLSRGRQMLQQELAATVEKTLRTSKPSSAFTVAVVAGLSAMMTSTATAAGIGTIAKAAGTGLAKSGMSSVVGISLFTMLIQLPFIAWLRKISVEMIRSQGERDLLNQFRTKSRVRLCVFIVVVFSSIWWQKFLPISPSARKLIIPSIMVVFLIINQIEGVKLARKMVRLRQLEGNDTPLQPICNSPDQATSKRNTLLVFLGSGLLVTAWSASLAVLEANWTVLVATVFASLGISTIAFAISRRFPNREFQCFAFGLGLTGLIGIAIIYWQRALWKTAPGSIPWHMYAMMATCMTMGVLITLTVKKIQGLPRTDN